MNGEGNLWEQAPEWGEKERIFTYWIKRGFNNKVRCIVSRYLPSVFCYYHLCVGLIEHLPQVSFEEGHLHAILRGWRQRD